MKNQKHMVMKSLIVKSVEESPLITMETNRGKYWKNEGQWRAVSLEQRATSDEGGLEEAYRDFIADWYKRYQVQLAVPTVAATDQPLDHRSMIKEIAHKIVHQLSPEHLEALFDIKKIDPRSEEFSQMLEDATRAEKEHLLHLEKHNVSEFTASITVKK